jgi:replicative DNA helicase
MSGGMRVENRVQEVSFISEAYEDPGPRAKCAGSSSRPALSSYRTKRSDKEPQLSDLRESGSLEQDADLVMFIHRPELYDKDTMKQNLAQIKVAKHRNGPVGSIEMVFRSNLAKFENAATRRVDLTQIA